MQVVYHFDGYINPPTDSYEDDHDNYMVLPHEALSVLANWACSTPQSPAALVRTFREDFQFWLQGVLCLRHRACWVPILRLTRNLARNNPTFHATIVEVFYYLERVFMHEFDDPNIVIPALGLLVNICSSRLGRTAVLSCDLDALAMHLAERWAKEAAKCKIKDSAGKSEERVLKKSAAPRICRLAVALLWSTSTFCSRNDVKYLKAWFSAVTAVAKEFPKDKHVIRTCLGAIRTRITVHPRDCHRIGMLKTVRNVILRPIEQNFPQEVAIRADVRLVKEACMGFETIHSL